MLKYLQVVSRLDVHYLEITLFVESRKSVGHFLNTAAAAASPLAPSVSDRQKRAVVAVVVVVMMMMMMMCTSQTHSVFVNSPRRYNVICGNLLKPHEHCNGS